MRVLWLALLLVLVPVKLWGNPTPKEVFEKLTPGWVSIKDLRTDEQLGPYLGRRAVALLDLHEGFTDADLADERASGPRVVRGWLHWNRCEPDGFGGILDPGEQCDVRFVLVMPHFQFVVLNPTDHLVDIRVHPVTPRDIYPHADFRAHQGKDEMREDELEKQFTRRFSYYLGSPSSLGRFYASDEPMLDRLSKDEKTRSAMVGQHVGVRLRLRGTRVPMGYRPGIVEGKVIAVTPKDLIFPYGRSDKKEPGIEYQIEADTGEVVTLRDVPRLRKDAFGDTDILEIKFRRTIEELAARGIELFGPTTPAHGYEWLDTEVRHRTASELDHLLSAWDGKLHPQVWAYFHAVITKSYRPQRVEADRCEGKITGDS